MYRFLLTRRWVALAVVAVTVAFLCARLGWWQLDQFDDRRAQSAVVEANLDADPVPVQRLAPVGEPVAADDEWQPVSMRGQYDQDGQVLLRYQTRGGLRGVDVVVPLVLADETAVLVDRGFLESPAGTPDASVVPAAPTGQVSVTGWLRLDSTADPAATEPGDGTVRALASTAMTERVGQPLRGGWVLAVDESPEVAGTELIGPEPPETGSGPHFFYGLQWFFFGLLALLAYGWFARDEAHPRAPARPPAQELARRG